MSDSRISIQRVAEETSSIEEEVRGDIYEGLTRERKDLSEWPKYLYDEEGSRLFEEITEQPEYYQTRTELSILEDFSDDIVSEGNFGELVELGSGSSKKTGILLETMMKTSSHATRYVPLDVSESAIQEGAERLRNQYPELPVSGYVGDFDGTVGEFLSRVPRDHGDRLVIFLGGTIGNFTPSRRSEFLKDVRSGLGRGDRFLVGVDLVKETSILEAAYDDEAGITASFNKNVLDVINASIGSDFDTSKFYHRALYNEEESRIEMWLVSQERQEVSLGEEDLSVEFEKGESVRTEISNKFTRQSLERMFEGSGMSLVEVYSDEADMFGLALGKPE